MNFLYPPKTLRLLYYCFYKAALTKNNSTPKLSSSITMAFTHGIQFLFGLDIIHLVLKVDLWNSIFHKSGKIAFGIAALMLLFLTNRYYTYSERHLKFLEEFEPTIHQKKRTTHIVIYLVITLAMLILSFLLLESLTVRS
ncbi:hypothetical protein [Spongiimicrobium salis]|uniref:hypothetical protein n=1 Tax=Spongiimicrobium salis TaxID=1667022 RepID=UPI00374C899E